MISSKLSVYSAAARTLMPGLLAGMMFLLAACANRLTADREGLLLQIRNDPSGDADESFINTVLLRANPHISPDSISAPVQSAADAVDDGVRKLVTETTWSRAEKVTIEVPLLHPGSREIQQPDLQQAIPQILARRMNSLDLQVTLRVAPENVRMALELAENMSSRSSASMSAISIGADAGIRSDVLLVDVIRSIRLVESQESGQ